MNPSRTEGQRAPTSGLEVRITRLRALAAIENLQNTFGYFADKMMWDQAASLFSSTATYAENSSGVSRGRTSIRRALEKHGPKGLCRGDLFNNMLLEPVIDVSEDGRTAKGRWRFLAQISRGSRDAVWSEGVYENTYIRQRGTWRIESHHSFVNSNTAYSAKQWGQADPATVGHHVSGGIGPDGPPSDSYSTFPDYSIPPFHYLHPVTGRPFKMPAQPR